MFAELQRHRREQWLRREYLLLDSWNHLARRRDAHGRLIAFFGSSNLFWPYSVDRQLAHMLSRADNGDVVLNLGSFGFGDSSNVVSTTLALLEAYRPRPIDLLVFEVTANEMPAIDKESARTFLPRSKRGQLVLDYEDAAPIVERMRHVQVPLRDNLERLAEIARAATKPFPVLLLDYESNLRQWPPSVSFFSVPLSAADAAEFRRLLPCAVDAVRRGDLTSARDLLARCEAIDPDVAIVSYLSAKVAEGSGDGGRALSLYRRSRDGDLLRGRLSRDQLMPELDRWCDALGFWFVSVPSLVRSAAGSAMPGFDQFVDDVHYRPHLHYAIARAIVERLGRERFLDAGRVTETLDGVLGAVDGQQVYTLLQTALNLVLAPASPYNDERVAEGLRKLDAAAGMGADPALVEEYRLRFMLLAGQRREAAGLLEQRALRALDPIELALRLSDEASTTDAPPAERLTRDEIAPRVRQLLLARFGVQVTHASADVELIAMGVDSLGLAELVMTLEEIFDVKLADGLVERQLTFGALVDGIAAGLVEPQARRVAYEKSLARTRALAARSPRPLGDLRMRPAAVIAADRRTWTARSVAAVLDEHFATLRDRPAITLMSGEEGGRRFVDWSWGDLDRESARMASYLHDCGVAAGQVVHLLTGHGAFTVSAIVGALRLGAIPSIGHAPSPKLTAEVFAETFAELVRRSTPVLVVVSTDLEPLIRQCLAAADLERPPRVVSSSAIVSHLESPPARTWPPPPADGDRVVLLQHSSGTTGARKAVIFTDGALLRQIFDYAHAIDLRHDDRIVSWLPLYHDMGLVACFLLPLLTGTPLTLMSPFEWVASPAMLFEAIGRDRGTLVWLPNFAFHLLADRVDPGRIAGLDLSPVRAFINCSEPVGRESWRRFHERFAFHGLSRFAFATCYAMAENVFAVTQGGTREPVLVDVVDAERLRTDGHAVPVDVRIDTTRPLRAVPASGTPVGGCRIRIVNARQGRRVLPDRRVGEIEIAGESLAPGYYRNDQATRAAFQGEWYRTTDVGYLADGHLFVLGRQSDVIIVAGVNVFADDVEAIVSGVAGVKTGRVAAFGVSDRRLGTERVVVLYECASRDLDEDGEIALGRVVQQRLHDALGLATCEVHAVPAGAIRKTSSGKVGRKRMKELFETGSFARRAEMARAPV